MRGDPPAIDSGTGMVPGSTPHARGSTAKTKIHADFAGVYPACAGIHPDAGAAKGTGIGLPRMRGDPPVWRGWTIPDRTSTPHARGSTSTIKITKKTCGVYPACAGIHLKNNEWEEKKMGLPRMRGDPPVIEARIKAFEESTPHARGSTLILHRMAFSSQVYPACAGIHRLPSW